MTQRVARSRIPSSLLVDAYVLPIMLNFMLTSSNVVK